MPPSDDDRWAVWVRLLLIAAVFAWWWPAGLEYRGDDYGYITFTHDLRRMLGAFVEHHGRIPRLLLLYRPLFLCSVGLEQLVTHANPFLSYLVGIAIHAAAAVAAFELLRRYLEPLAAAAAAAFWALHPGQVDAVWYLSARSDLLCGLFSFLALHFEQLRRAGRLRQRWPALVAFIAAIFSKETAYALPGVVWVLGCFGAPDAATRLRARALDAVRDTMPWIWTAFAALCLRYVVLGDVVGGYPSRTPNPLAPLGFVQTIVPAHPNPVEIGLLVLGAGFWLARCSRRALRAAPICLLLYAGVNVTAVFAGGEKDPRYDYLPSAAIAGALALSGPIPPLLVLGAQFRNARQKRADLLFQSSEIRAVRARGESLLAAAKEDPVFLDTGHDRYGRPAFQISPSTLALPPFGTSGRIVLAARPAVRGAPEQEPGPFSGTLETLYRGPALLDAASLAHLDATLALGGVRASRYEVLVAAERGWMRVGVAADGNGAAPLGDVLNARLLGVPERRLADELWLQLESSMHYTVYVYVTAFEADGRRLGSSARPLPLAFGRDYHLWLAGPPNGHLGLLLAFGAIALAATLIGRTARAA